jgi:DNA replication protein DnaC
MVHVNEIVQRLLSNIPHISETSDDESIKDKTIEANEPEVKCDLCDSTGLYRFVGRDGLPDIIPCPRCQSERMVKSILKQSGLTFSDYARFTFDTFDENRSVSAREMKNLALKYFSEFPEEVGFGVFGKSGRGKTHICVALCQAITKKYRVPHFYFSYTREMDTLVYLKKFKPLDYQTRLNLWIERENVYIDDLLKLSNKGGTENICFDQTEIRVLYDLLNGRYWKRNRTFFSSEFTVNQIQTVDEGIGTRIFMMIDPYGLMVKGGNERLRREIK